jgi:hypothetical protein
MSDMVNSPKHYEIAAGVETIDVIRKVLGEEGFKTYCHGNVIKYVLRAPFKGEHDQDLRKASRYLNWAINDLG